ncbi:nitric oxide reductase transcriptional regulator NorR [Rhizobacter sp. Root1221]|uniref:nitric oxide reductase transcriptional regulator NorR n=1 Tax=Rhizobacter sp. Root1221 TaxID=1736433 RepID=UPI0006FEB333|nr:nitric oxide reductase transcriptional regulator NorR [Rhizobacter sp. Root1221]KQV97605.1 transcriptional regulator [Rhizobacter sp. Root1221]
MTPTPLLDALVPLVADLARDLPERERYRRLLETLRVVLPSDAAALLKLDGEVLVPLAVDGLSDDTLGRRFQAAEHPRLAALLDGGGPIRFAPDCGLPDPYDGLVDGAGPHLEVHDCMGCVLRVAERPWGVLTLDALDPSRFSAGDLPTLQAFASLAEATVRVAERIDQLALRAEGFRAAAGPRPLLGHSAAFKTLQKEIALLGSSELTVLIGGETGVGKELVAKAIHAASSRATRPLISLNCAALPDTLVESELFGHVRGAFTGAVADRRGKFELADGGTLFLDEVGELPLAAQAKLLRVLQGGQLQRVGSDREPKVDVRLIAATNRDLAEEVRAGRFRADLYHRLSVYPLRVPPLRERGRDVLLISGSFLEENRSRLGLGGLRLAPDAQAALLAHPWPGNVRELEHTIARCALRAFGQHTQRPRILTLTAADFDIAAAARPVDTPAAPPAVPSTPGTLRDATGTFQRHHIEACLLRHQGNRAAAARELGMDRANLARLVRRLTGSVNN